MSHLSNHSFDIPHGRAVILIPAFNEEASIGEVLLEVKDHSGLPVVVIDDASTDQTVAVAQASGATVVSLAAQLGAWGATQTGLRYALRHGYVTAVTMDADGQHEAQSITSLLSPVKSGEADVAIGACTTRGSILRQIAWILMKKVSGLTIEDVTSGFRVYNHRAMQELASWRATLLDYQDIGVLLLLQSKGLVIKDVAVPMRQRHNGKSRVFRSWMIVFKYMCQTLLLGLSKRGSQKREHGAKITS